MLQYEGVLTLESVDEIPKCWTIQVKVIDQCVPVVLFIMLYGVVLILSLWIKSMNVAIQMKAIEH